MVAENQVDPQTFRQALSNFATGVTVVTAVDQGGSRVGVTVNSFSSVSLQPPLVLWSLNRTALSLPVFEAADSFIVNVLAEDQVDICAHFARQGDGDKFADIEVVTSGDGTPMLPGCAAYFQCSKKFTYEGGDHLIYVGEVREFSASDRAGLIYHKGKYVVSGPHPVVVNSSELRKSPSFVQEYLDYLLSQVVAGFEAQFQAVLDEYHMTRFEWRALCCISEFAGIGYADLSRLTIIPDDMIADVVLRLKEDGWVRLADEDTLNPRAYITPAGLDHLVPLLAAGKAHEADAMSDLSAGEAQYIKEMLKTMLRSVNRPLCQLTDGTSTFTGR